MLQRDMTQIILGLGSNLGDSEDNLRRAIKLIKLELLTDVLESHIYKSAPLLPKNASADWNREFSNMVITGELKQDLTPVDFLSRIKEYEAHLGRKPSAHWAPREIDIDILAWGNEIIDLPALKIPHPEILKRDFVMKPLLEILPGWKHP